jgi:transmembrane sensor
MHFLEKIKYWMMSREDREEADRIRQWKQESSQTLNALKANFDLHSLSDELEGYNRYDKQKAWTTLESKINHKPTVNYLRYTGYAAAVAVLLFAVIAINPFSSVRDGQVTEYIAGTHQKPVTLMDGTVVLLDKASTLYVSGQRSVVLSGRAYFDVFSDAAHPFSIRTEHGSINVPGTAFSVLADDMHTEILVTEGKVEFTDQRNETHVLQQGAFLFADQSATRSVSKDAELYLSWKKQELRLRNARLGDFAEAMSDFYKIRIIIDPALDKTECRVNTGFTMESLDEALNELSLITGLQYKFENDHIRITGIKC